MKILLNRCSCSGGNYARLPRSFWMRLFPARRLFQCEVCQAKVFAIQAEIDSVNWEVNTGKFHAAITKTKQT